MANLKASINFGLVHIPVEIITAEDRSESVSFHLLDSKDNSRIRFKRVNENSGREVEWDDIVKGFEVSDGEYVVFTDEELKELAADTNRSLEIDAFVDKTQVPTTLFETPYYLAPLRGGEKGYAILAKALEKSEKLAVIQAVLRNKEQLAVIYSQDGGLILEILRYPNELKDAAAPESQPRITEREIAMADKLIKSMTKAFKPDKYRDDYIAKVKAAVAQKRKGKRTKRPMTAKKNVSKKIVDIAELLEASLASNKKSSRRKAA